jgi:uncharacterized glyoxalase superfamily protein PhnB
MQRGTIRPMTSRCPEAQTLSNLAELRRVCGGTFERLQASGAEVVQEPIDQPYGVRDCAFRDPAGNLIRIQELRQAR